MTTRQTNLRSSRFALCLIGVISVCMGLQASAQDVQTRADEVQQQRQEKAERLYPPQTKFLERALTAFKDGRILEKFTNGIGGFKPKLGGLAPGSGFALGAEYRNQSLADGTLDFHAAAQGSLTGYRAYALGIEFPHVGSDRLFVGIDLGQRDLPRQVFYGLGLDSKLSDRTNYRLQDRSVTATAGVRLRDGLTAGLRSGLVRTRVGPGTDPRFSSTTQAMDESAIPALATQPDHHFSEAFVELDTRDRTGNPRSGGRYSASAGTFKDIKLHQYSYNRWDVAVEHYIPFFNQRRVIALRAIGGFTSAANQNQRVPFFAQPDLGGSRDLRGFHDSRFRDRNMTVLNAEYRWEVFPALDMALFADAGQVASNISDFRLGRFQTSYGLGLRFNTTSGVFLRTDLAYSPREGHKTIITFGHAF